MIDEPHGEEFGLMTPWFNIFYTYFFISSISMAENLYIPMLGKGASRCK